MDYQNAFEALVKNEIRIAYEKAETKLPLGASKIGGKPHLPRAFEWPYYEGESYDDIWENRPLAFLMQINLAEIKAYDTEHRLPEKGMLYFFYDMITMKWGIDSSDEGSARVFYYDVEANELVETDFPEFPEEEDNPHDFPECQLTFSTEKSIPSYEEFSELYDDTDWEEYDEAAVTFGIDIELDPAEHTKLLGYADLIQGDIGLECEMGTRGVEWQKLSPAEKADVREKARDFVLLAQIGTIEADGAEWMWGDCGCLYFCMRREDLEARNFDAVWMVLQCG